jgi:DNA-binding transcriptional MerR regulator
MTIGEFARRSRLSPKALRLYDELGLLPPSRVEDVSGYRYYEAAQLERARMISTLRQLGVSLATIKELLELDPHESAHRITGFWQDAEEQHTARRRLASLLVDQLEGRKTVMYEVATREVPQRSLLCLGRNVDPAGAWALGKHFIGILRDQRWPRMEGREGAAFSIYWSEVSVDSDGPVEWCKPVPEAQAESLAAQFPELTLRVEPAHREAYVALGKMSQDSSIEWQLAEQALRGWAEQGGIQPEKLTIKPEDLGLRITYLFDIAAASTDCDFAVPFA